MPGVYLSYPFCTQKCTFCNFASGVSPVEDQQRYERALLTEVRSHDWRWMPDTVYWGGGTPSIMPLDVFSRLMSVIPSRSLREVTVECAPGTITGESAGVWNRCGVNRVSLGVQSFVTEEARRTGRKHTPEIVEQDLELLARAGITNVNIDLIAGLPGQTFDSWQQSLDWISRLNPPHVSIYLFEMDEDSKLGREAMLGGVRYGAALLPTDDAMASLYDRAVEHLSATGIRRYEISNFAREGFESRHNLKYWQLDPYVGFGLDAHSFDGIARWSNPDDLAEYCQRIEGGPGQLIERSISDIEEEHFFVGLRLSSGIEPTEREWSRFAEPLRRLTGEGLLQREGRRLRMTERGFLLSNEIFQEFIQVEQHA
jgi:oxygen-independent coproporphyrinogen-3 oxidase